MNAKFKCSLFISLVVLAGCTTVQQSYPLYTHRGIELKSYKTKNCAAWFDLATQTVNHAGVYDSQTANISNFPYLRVNRFLQSFRNRPLSKQQFQFWVDEMQGLANQAWLSEFNNLSQADQDYLRQHLPDFVKPHQLMQGIKQCGLLLRKEDLANQETREYLKQHAVVPSQYQLTHRILGIYPLYLVPISFGVDGYHKKTRKLFATPLNALPQKGKLQRFIPSHSSHRYSSRQIARILKQSSNNPLKIPQPNKQQLKKLFETFAPLYEIDVASNDDRIGQIFLNQTGIGEVNTLKPTIYEKTSYTNWQGKHLLQLNYIIWLPARTVMGSFDFLGGHLDGLTWRVTIGRNGKPLLFDTMHNCGCYHMFFPTNQLQQRPATRAVSNDERAFVPQQAPTLHDQQRIVLRLASVSHYIERVYLSKNSRVAKQPYQTQNYNTLRSLPYLKSKHKSLFQPNGLIKKTDRKERWPLWPMGVPSAGAMRQWGHHLTAFIGERYFDEPDLINNNFRQIPKN